MNQEDRSANRARLGAETQPDNAASATRDPDATVNSSAAFGISPLSGAINTKPISIGPYRLSRRLGEGGMGQVWLAEQTEPVRRTVALKLIRVGMYDDSMLRRFQSERQSLAIMDHPSIAKVFDAGATPDGQPYFVMEYVPGVPITNYCDQKRLKIRDRLELMVKVCEGVQHAHQKAIIHRDLKPANILVQEVDGNPAPRIIDFGLAKAIAPQPAGESLYTQVGSLVGTPGYMSPEQCDPTALDVDTRTDVYSLGVVLYVLLTGSLPFEAKARKEQGFGEMLRQLREEDPPRPSAKVIAEREASAAVADVRDTMPRQLVSLLRGDLDWVTMKALDKDRSRRYATPAELAADIRRYLQNEPVQAHPPGVWYRGNKFLRRYKVPVAAAVLVLATLVAGLYTANRERMIAQRRFQDVRELANKLFDIDVQVRELPGSIKTRQLIVDTALQYLRGLTADVRGDPGLALEVGNAYMRVARVQGVPISATLGQTDQAKQNLRIADGFIQSVLKAQPGNRIAMLRAAQIAHDQMILARFKSRGEEAFEDAKRSAGWLDKFHAGKGDEAESSAILNTYFNVADEFKGLGQFDDALRMSSRGTEVAKLFHSQSQEGNFLIVSALVYQARGNVDQAFSDIQQSVKLLDPGPDWITKGGRTANFQHALVYQGRILGEDNSPSMGRPAEGVKSLEEAFKIADAFVHRDVNDHAFRGDLAMAGISMGDLLRHSDPRRALEVYDHTLRHLAEAPGDTHLERFEVNLLAGSSYALRSLGRRQEAKRRLADATDHLKRLGLYRSDSIDLESEAEVTFRAIADDQADSGNTTTAIDQYENLLNRVDPVETDPDFNAEDAVHLSTICSSLAALYSRAGHADLAAALENRRAEIWRQLDRKLPNNPFVQRRLAEKAFPRQRFLGNTADKLPRI